MVMPWKNGGGVTRELFRLGPPEAMQLRLSQATVSRSGPFSAYPGLARHLVLLEGEGLALTLNGRPVLLDSPHAVFHFQGEDRVEAKLITGPVEDFNVMIDRGYGNAEVTVLETTHAQVPMGRHTFLYLPAAQRLWVGFNEGLDVEFEKNERVIKVRVE